ncbi:hypothetical protein [Erwinia sorbitola]|uniref:Lipocalin-like domain-containing protein n=1 Tax=Erwinia sorbitola TaxID=2681984 RepID=A0A6I6EVM5_9GAMM|nr:hypothetical protein [Erwinia sorbitola]MTD29157.1 hypothetical protein [Erwinia sorbitola]QGU86000.1 hypothetical protein GN242_01590 [Erwinia sorbitola]
MKYLMIASLLVSQPLMAAAPDYATLEGTWQVDAVHVDSSGIQAVVENDPQYIGAEVTFSPDKILWTKGTPQRPVDPATDNCLKKPQLTSADENDPENGYQVAGGFNVICGDEPWGPGAVVTKPVNDTLTLYWYDGAILELKKELR